MDILFRKSASGREPSLVTRGDGVRLSVPVYGKLVPMPHDLIHFTVERELGLPDAFWSSVAAGAIFDGMAVVSGRQPPHAAARSKAIMKANHHGINFSEIVVEEAGRALLGRPLKWDALPVASPHIPSQTRADRDDLLARLLPALQAMRARWDATPIGESLLVVWPSRNARYTPLTSQSHKREVIQRGHGR